MDRIHNLFHQHASDLERLFEGISGVYICPICHRAFDAEDLDSLVADKALSIGHVWQSEIRKSSTTAKRQTVLLCGKCNWQAGSHGDAILQQMHLVKEGDSSGILHGVREIQILPISGDAPFEVHAKVEIRREGVLGSPGARLTMKPSHMPPDNVQKWCELDESQGVFHAVVHPLDAVPAYKRPLAAAGLLTSAYLMAFYAMGYRYILHECVDDVRSLIVRSFRPSTTQPFDYAPSENVKALETRDRRSCPQICLVVPPDDGRDPHVRVEYLTYGAILPLPPSCGRVLKVDPDLNSSLKERREEIRFDISTHKPHEGWCLVEYILGEPRLPIVEEGSSPARP